jgi:predicted aspartyl protease
VASGSRIAGGEAPYVPAANLATVADIYRRMTAPVRVNGAGPFAFVVDTGANQSVISQELADRLALPAGPTAAINGVAGVQSAPTTSAILSLGGRTRQRATLSVLPSADIGGDGFLGLDRLEGQAVTLDFKGQALRIEGGRRIAADPNAVVLAGRRRDGQLTLVDADLAGVRVVAFLDSGAQNTIGNLALRALAVSRNPESVFTPTPILSATGQTIEADMAALPRLRIGGLRLPYWPVAFADLHTFRLWNLVERPAILLGVDILSRFSSVCLNFARDEVSFRLPTQA